MVSTTPLYSFAPLRVPDLDETQYLEEWLNLPPATPEEADCTQFATSNPHEEDRIMNVSSAFYYGADISSYQDLVLVSEDSVYFYVNKERLAAASDNFFGGLLEDMSPVLGNTSLSFRLTNDHSDILNVILHSIFGMSCAAYSPSFEAIQQALHRMKGLGMHPEQYIAPSSPLYSILLSYAPFQAIEVYSIAAEYDIEELAVSSSSHLLSFKLHMISEALAIQIGAPFLRRLFFMHLGREAALKSLLETPPYPHPPQKDCNRTEQKSLAGLWARTIVMIEPKADTSNHAIRTAFTKALEGVSCDNCRDGLKKRLNEIIIAWSQTKCTI